MEKQAIILFLLLGVLLASKGMNFADESIPVRQPIPDKLARAARHFLGLPYRWGGMSERRGMDCSGWSKRFLPHCTLICPGLPANNLTPGKTSLSKTCKRVT